MAEAPATVGEALREGNRLFRRGDVDAAASAYRRAGDRALRDDPLLAYNLATALHHLGRLPEAVLWYRRAQRHLADDPWLSDNLAKARTVLAAPRPGPPPVMAPLLLHRWILPLLAIAAAWWALVGSVFQIRGQIRGQTRGRPINARLTALLLGAAAMLWLAQVALDRLGPRPAVLLQPCSGSLPAGSEVWVRPADSPSGGSAESSTGDWIVRGPDGMELCPETAVVPV